MPQYNHIGDKIRHELEEVRHWSQKTLVELGNFPNPRSALPYICRMLKATPGKYCNPSPATIQAICKAFGWELQDFWKDVVR